MAAKYLAAQALTRARSLGSASSLVSVSRGSCVVCSVFDFYSCAVSQSLERLREGEVFAHLDEFDDVAARAAGEAFEDLLCRVDVEAWPVVFVEGTQA